MAQLAGNYEERQEFWKPAVPLRQDARPSKGQVCDSCGADFLDDARFCHVCGTERKTSLRQSTGIRTWLAFTTIREALGQTTASLVALVLGVTCIIAALITGLMYTAATVLDWQAVQVWRIEWLLAGIAMFVAGILLKKR